MLLGAICLALTVSLAFAETYSKGDLSKLRPIETGSRLKKRQEHQSVFSSPSYREIDPHLSSASSFIVSETKITEEHTHLRLSPIVDGIPVYGADRVFTMGKDSWLAGSIESKSLHKRSIENNSPEWLITSKEALKISRIHSSHLGTDKKSAKVEKVWFSTKENKNNHLVPAWKVYDTSKMIRDRELRFIDAQFGNILATIPLVANDQGYVFPPAQFKLKQKPPLETLPLVLNSSLKGIVGSNFRSMNSCKYHKCVNSNTTVYSNDTCTINNTACVEESEIKNLSEGVDYYSVKSWFTTRGKDIDITRDWEADGYPGGNVQMVWLNAPTFGPRLERPANGQPWGSDIDFTSYSDLSFTDTFSELQAYYSLNLHHKFMSSLLNVTTETGICLMGTGINCLDIDPVTNVSANAFNSPLKFVVNLPSIGSPGPENGYDTVVNQIARGLGKNTSNPVVFPTWDDFPDAFFANGNSLSPPNVTESEICANYTPNSNAHYSCLSIYDAPFTFIAFGQSSSGGDWALNDCIVYHELTHAFVAKLAPTLSTYLWDDENGISSDPGAMNEGWADYFAAIHCQAENFATGTYNGHPFRSILNDWTCIDNVGEIHYDGTIFSGGLWKVRKQILQTQGLSSSDQTLFDQVVLQAMALATSTETFKSQYSHVLNLLESHPKLNIMYSFAKQEFENRVLNCTRITNYPESLDSSFTLPNALITSKNVSVLPNQLRFMPRASDWGVQLYWNQRYMSPYMGAVKLGYAKANLFSLWSINCPMSYVESVTSSESNGTLLTGTNTLLRGVVNCNQSSPINGSFINWTKLDLDTDSLVGSSRLQFIPGSVHSIYFVAGHQQPATLKMGGFKVVLLGMHQVWQWTIVICGAINGLVHLIFLFYLLFRFIQYKRNRNPKFVSLPFKVIGMHLISTTLSFGCMVSSIIGVIYGPARDISLQTSIAVFAFVLAIDHFSTRMVLEPSRINQVLSLIQILSLIAAFIMTFFYNSPFALHVIFYSLFIASFVLKLWIRK